MPAVIGRSIRLTILDMPIFAKLLAEREMMIRSLPRDILLSALSRMAGQAPFYIYTAFVFTYGVTTLHVSRELRHAAVLATAARQFANIPLFGHISGRLLCRVAPGRFHEQGHFARIRRRAPVGR
ncbi:hypothetical protein SAMN05421548_13546 [Paraburkholderia lycopersici]|uniref:Uncharacterized protein n=1 Tax=Paraburkholderia lycopersici TaxID=416944 RepID=A0A1G7ARP9_9BURK|nr:hypothetical protein SAMN05421548_13546 [Paraburkholderia lycopersici]